MHPLPLALIVYSSQVLLVVCAASLAEMLVRVSAPTARLTYWRAVAALCLALPFIPTSAPDLPPVSVTFGALPSGGVADATVTQVLPALGLGIAGIWAAGVILGGIWLLAGAWRIRQLRQESTPAVMAPDIDALRGTLAPRARFRWSHRLQQPVTLGMFRPLILLPRRFGDLTDNARRAVACHELLHVQRGDWLWVVLEAHVRIVFWFHPGFWWLFDRIHLLREQVVDELVIARTSSRRDYMTALMMFAGGQRSTALSSAFLRRRHLKARLRALSKETHMSFPRLMWTMLALTLTMSGVTAATVRALPLDLSAIAQTSAASRMEIRLAESAFTPGLREIVVSGSNQRIYLYPTALATWADVTVARIVDPGTPQMSVAVTFNRTAAARMASATVAHLGKPVAIILDGRVIAAPIVRAPISDSAMLTGITAATARELIDANLACQTNAAQCAAAVLPVPTYQEKPQYTQAAMAAGIEGNVLLEVVVSADGSVGAVTVVKSLDTDYGLDQQAVEALKHWQWKPGTRGGEPVQVAVHVEMTFTLK
jgi:TonB family protein